MKRERRKILLPALAALLVLAAACLPPRGQGAGPSALAPAPISEGGAVTELTLTAGETRITAAVPDYGAAGGLQLVRFKAHQYHESAAFIPEYDGVGDDNQRDGYDTDRAYYAAAASGFAEGAVTGGGTLSIDRFSGAAGEEGFDKIYDKFYILSGGAVSGGRVTGGAVVDGPKFVAEVAAERDFTVERPASIKGLETVNYDDAEKLGVKHSSVGLDINLLLTAATAADAIPFESNGKTYYFSQNNLRANDTQIIGMTAAGFLVTQLLLIWGSSVGANSILAHPDYVRISGFPLSISAPNLTTEAAVNAYVAVYEFLADRYTRPDKRYGRVVNFVIGNEVESACQWNNMGYLPIDEYIRQYERAVRLAYNAVKKTWAGATVLICTSHFWGVDVATQFINYDPVTYRPFIGKGSFTSKQIITEFAREAKAGGDYPWQLAYHPYRANAIGESVFWNDVNYEACLHDEDAPKVSTLNIEVLTDCLKKPEIAYRGEPRDFYVTEYGAGTPHRADVYDPDFLTDEDLNNQAASYIYTYYTLYFAGAKAFIWHRQFDVSNEGGENLGVWTRQKNTTQDLYKKKPLWDVMKYIDTKYSYQYTAPYLQFIKKYPSDDAPKSWAEIVPGFDVKKLEGSPLPEESDLLRVENYGNDAENCGFEGGETGGWAMADAATSCNAVQDASAALSGGGSLVVHYAGVGAAGGGRAEKGIVRVFDEPADLRAYSSFNLAVNLGEGKAGVARTVTARFYSGEHIAEYKAAVAEAGYVRLSAAIGASNWAYFDRVDRIKIWYSSDDPSASAGTLYFDDIGFAKAAETDGKGGCRKNAAALPLVLSALALPFLVKRRSGRIN
ncbi:MAG: DUF5722 domain-containing protein [Clostridiales bacterium]|nr:DUF5722 domain-containing protein [Clostridiales bacterium]